MEIDRDALLQTFQEESQENMRALEEALVDLENRPEDDGLLQMIFRIVHTFKGNASMVGLEKLAELAHVLEDLLECLREHTVPVTADLITLLLRSVDALRDLVPGAIAGSEEIPPAHAALLKQIYERLPASVGEGASGPSVVVAERRQGPAGRRESDGLPRGGRPRTLRVDIGKLDRMLNLAGEIAIAQGRLRQVLEERGGRLGEEALEIQGGVDRMWMDLQELIMKARMVPLGPVFRQYIRTVRDVARTHCKIASLVIEGEDVEVDTTVVEHLRDPLTHMIRNAVDHGIELPEERRARGKDPCGRVNLRAFHDTGNLVIQLSDDGAGFNRERIVAKARVRGSVGEPEKMIDTELYALAFEPGFSTAEIVTELSGRGVGMDIVRKNIDALRGTVAIDSKDGEGATITIRLPLTVATIEGMAVGVGGESYLIPLDAVLECVELPEEERRFASGRGVLNLRGEALPYLRLRDVFRLGGEAPRRESVVVVRQGGRSVGLAVDLLHGESQAVIKPLGKLFQGIPSVAGSTILGNGRVALILDVPGLLREAERV
jgi:two-component system chemotaxis sensor kinase CheA